ncbi:MAG TPA: hypothetical protein VMW15_03500, partial [Terracidiphilus sp.]|nr:hypothetical protein [Terracidiphilus sp.]
MRRESHAPFCERLAAKSRRPTHQLIGNYQNQGRQWRKAATADKVKGHDFPGPEVPRAYPYGIYDLGRNA